MYLHREGRTTIFLGALITGLSVIVSFIPAIPLVFRPLIILPFLLLFILFLWFFQSPKTNLRYG